jgi:hypothetical protein
MYIQVGMNVSELKAQFLIKAKLNSGQIQKYSRWESTFLHLP